jgi:UDP-N-acetylglucosamine 2-epimerase (non-hydrolysing)
MAPVVRQLGATSGISSRVCVTAQHREMLDQVLTLFEIQPDVDLNLMKPNQTLSGLTAAIFTQLDPIIAEWKPDWVLVQGDTTTVMATTLVAYYHQVLVGHVEAGLRTSDKWQPFPEEINRHIVGVTADLHFAPTEWAMQNLLRENVPAWQVVVTGNPVIDALRMVVEKPLTPLAVNLFEKLGLSEHKNALEPRLLMVTAHRRENFGVPLENICTALLHLAEHYKKTVHLIYPVHLNPNVQEPVHRLLGGVPNITLLPPLDYLPFVQLMKRSTLVLTDSGGLQEEAPGLGVPVLVMRETTERPEGVQAGTVKLVGTNPTEIFETACKLLDEPAEYSKMAQAVNPYGDGRAAHRIVEAILQYKVR